MAANVFGNPVTDDIVRQLDEYVSKDVITQLDRAKVAYLYINANGKDTNALQFVENLKAQYGNGICTLCLFYNATGGPVTFITTHDYHGNIWKVPYPNVFQNGQWAAFLHEKGTLISGSSAALVYRGTNDEGNMYDYMCSWGIPYVGGNHAYTKIRDKGHFDDIAWGVIQDKMGDAGLTSKDQWNGCESFVTIGDTTTVIYQATLTLSGVIPYTGAYLLPPTTAGKDEA